MKINICLARFFNLLIISIVLLGRVLDYCPLQQGLRPCRTSRSLGLMKGTRLLSITTRIKTLASRPLVTSFFKKVLDYCPLQQGLRLPSVGSTENCLHSTRLLSITTRIKAIFFNHDSEFLAGTRLLSIATRIKTA